MVDYLTYLLAVCASIVYAVYHIRLRYTTWTRMGVPQVHPRFPFGTLTDGPGLRHECEQLQAHYIRHKAIAPFVGLYFFLLRAAMIIDLDLLKRIMIADFKEFNARPFYHNERDDPLSAHLFALGGSKWKRLRTKLTPTFTSGKMKYMFPTVLEIGDRLTKRLAEVIGFNGELEMKDYWARYTTDVIGVCAFGLACDTLNGINGEFREAGRIMFEEPRRSVVMQTLMNNMVPIGNWLRIKQIPSRTAEFFADVVRKTIAFRESNSACRFVRKDFMNLLLDLKDDPTVSLTNNEIAAQAFVFYIAGFETSSTLLSFCSYELAKHQDIQQRVRDEIGAVLKRYNGHLTYDAMLEMRYLEQVLNEALRKYPPLATIARTAQRNYNVPGTNAVIPSGCSIVIPVYAIHHDADLYPEPDRFDPERFTDEQILQRHPMAFIPFGEGPRICIGQRFGMMQARIGLVKVLQNFRLSVGEKMIEPIMFATRQPIIASKNGIWLRLERIQADE